MASLSLPGRTIEFTKTQVKLNLTVFKQFSKDLTSLIDELDRENIQEDLVREKELYAHETYGDRYARSKHNESWRFHAGSDLYDSIEEDDVLCALENSNECWYCQPPGNPAVPRISSYSGSYRLKGTDDVWLCDECFHSEELRKCIRLLTVLNESVAKNEKKINKSG
jgi:hypothetical protein